MTFMTWCNVHSLSYSRFVIAMSSFQAVNEYVIKTMKCFLTRKSFVLFIESSPKIKFKIVKRKSYCSKDVCLYIRGNIRFGLMDR